ncbi:MAG: hypothetical protein K6F87_03515 [Lachnospiraceae bacterium]|nr:hypothetical protein [Lachnospiraceae bacterium]
MDSFGADYVTLAEKFTKLFELSVRLCGQTGVIADFAADLDIFWDGDANAAFISGIGDDLTKMGVIILKVRETVAKAVKVFELYMQNETEVKRMIGDYRI